LVVQFFIAKPHQVSGSSMVPNFENGDYIITNIIGLKFSPIKRGEVLIFKNPRDTSVVFIKRVIGLPGETIKVEGGKTYVNDKLLSEPYLPPGTPTNPRSFMAEGEEITVPQDQYIVFGDNREGSSDSREWGTLPKDLIIGQALFRYWPVNKMEILKIGEPSN
jgi:signal peptidase I